VFAGQQFASLTFTLTQPLPQSFLSFQWNLPTIPAGLTFASTGGTTLNQTKGSTGDPVNPYVGSTGAINVASTVPPGTYAINVTVSGFSGGGTYTLVGQLTVASTQGPPTGLMWMEA
jgi:hypothetical protein